MRILALGGVAGPGLLVFVITLCGALRPSYSHASQFISELGATGTPHAALMNVAGFMVSGTAIAAFGFSLAAIVPRRPFVWPAAALVGLLGLGLAAAGGFPCAPGCPQGEPTVHDSVSIAAFLCGIAGSALFSRIFRSIPKWSSLWLYSAVSSVVALCLLATLAASIESRVMTGLWQRLLLGTLLVWCAIVGVHAFRVASASDRPA